MDKKFQQLLLSSLGGKNEIPRDGKIVPCRALSLDKAWEIYQNNYYRNLQKSLAQTYEACFTLLSEEIFEKIAFSFIQEHPLKQSDLAFYGEEFSLFLSHDEMITSAWPFLPELARMENLIKKSFLNDISRTEMEIFYPVHQIWQSLLYEGDEIKDFDGKMMLTISKDDEDHLFFNLGEIP